MARNEIMQELEARGISTRPGTHAVHTLTYYRETYGTRPEDLPGALTCHNQSMAIPLHNQMTDADYEYVVNTLKQL